MDKNCNHTFAAGLCNDCAIAALRAKLCEESTPKFFEATLRVTFMDGAVIDYPNVRFAARLDVRNPITVEGTTLRFEDLEREHTALGVRSYTMETE